MDRYLTKRFDIRSYNCWHLVREVWQDLKGEDLGELMTWDHVKETSRFSRIEKPQSPCIVLMLRDRHTPHVGVYYCGKVLHIKASGAQYVPLNMATVGFQKTEFYLPCL